MTRDQSFNEQELECNTQSITRLTAGLAEITANVRILLEDSKELRSCLHLLYEHDSKIKINEEHIRKNELELEQLQEQFEKMKESYLIIHTERRAYLGFMSLIVQYGPLLMAIFSTVVSLIIALKEF